MEMLQARGAEVSYHDPYVPSLPRMRHHTIQLDSSPLTEEFAAGQDCFLIVTDHSNVDYRWLARHARLIVDTRNAMTGIHSPTCRIEKA
jgi:UDP-N-acetyl-D-glucosamine dehydrogenase